MDPIKEEFRKLKKLDQEYVQICAQIEKEQEELEYLFANYEVVFNKYIFDGVGTFYEVQAAKDAYEEKSRKLWNLHYDQRLIIRDRELLKIRMQGNLTG